MDDVSPLTSTRGPVPWLATILVAVLVLSVVSTWSAEVEHDRARREAREVAVQRLVVERQGFEAFFPRRLEEHARELAQRSKSARWLSPGTPGTYVQWHAKDGRVVFPVAKPFRSRAEVLAALGPVMRDLIHRIDREAAASNTEEVRARLPLLLESSDREIVLLGRERKRAHAHPTDAARSLEATLSLLRDGIGSLPTSSIFAFGMDVLGHPELETPALEETLLLLAGRLFPELDGDRNPVHAWCRDLSRPLADRWPNRAALWERAITYWNVRPRPSDDEQERATTPPTLSRSLDEWVQIPLDVPDFGAEDGELARASALLSPEGLERLWSAYVEARDEEAIEPVIFFAQTAIGASSAGEGVSLPLHPPHEEFELRAPLRFATFFPWRTFLTVSFLVACLAFILFGARLVQKQARATSEQMKERASFLATIAHQLKTPVANLRLFAETLAQGRAERPEDRERMEGILASEARKLGEQLERLLAFSRLDQTSTTDAMLEPIDLPEFLGEMHAHWEPLAARRDVALVLDVEEAPSRWSVERSTLRDGLHNVIDNAVQHAPSGSTVLLQARLENERLVVRVRDRGRGIDPRDRPRVFERFYRGHREKDGSGTGLGLFIAAQAARRSKGEIRIEDTSERGTTIAFTFEEQIA